MASRSPRTTDGAKSAGREGVKSCLRAIDVIEFFTQAQGPARTMEISEALGIPNSSADEILRTLAGTGYLSYNRATKQYSPSYKLVAKAQAIERRFFGGEFIPALLEDLRQQTGATAYVTVQNDCWVENVAEVRGAWTLPDMQIDYPTEIVRCDNDSWRPGTNFAAALLAQQSNVEIIALVRRAQKLGLGPQRPSMMKTLVDRVARTRARGFSRYRRNDGVRLESIAVPLRIPRSVTSYAVGVVGDSLCANDAEVKMLAQDIQRVITRHSERFRRQPKPPALLDAG